jgi:hypothetical protein
MSAIQAYLTTRRPRLYIWFRQIRPGKWWRYAWVMLAFRTLAEHIAQNPTHTQGQWCLRTRETLFYLSRCPACFWVIVCQVFLPRGFV